MKKSTRNVLIIVSVVLTIFTAIIGYGIYSVYSFFNRLGEVTETEIPNDLKQARILTGNDFVRKTEFFKLNGENLINTIGKSSNIQDEKKRQQYIDSQTARNYFGFDDIKVCGDEIVAVGKFGGIVFAKDGNVSREIMFEPKTEKIKILFYEQKNYRPTLDNLQIYDFEGDGKCEFFSYSSTDGVVVFDSEGNASWRYGERDINLGDIWREKSEEEREKESWIIGAFAGDLNNDGIGELIVTQKADGIRAFDVNHNEIWFQPDKFPLAKYKIFDSDGDGNNDVLEFQGVSSALRNAQNGEKLKDLKLDSGLDDVVIFKDKNGKTKFYFLIIDDNKIKLSDISNKIILESDAPLSDVKKNVNEQANVKPKAVDYYQSDSETVYQPKAVSVKLKADAPEYLAVVASFVSIPRSDFYIYDNAGKLVYHELLPENAKTISVVSASDGKQEILVGGKSSIWKYSVK